MAKFTVIGDVSLELRRQIYQSLTTTSEVSFNLGTETQAIFIGPPDSDSIDAQAVLALYLYFLTPSSHLRNQRPLPDPVEPGRFRMPPLPLELRYLLVPLTEDETGQQHLGRILQHFHDHRWFSELGGEPIGDSFGGASHQLRVSFDPLTLEQITQLWSAFSAPLRLAVGLSVEVVPIDSALPPDRLPRVDEALVVTGTKKRAHEASVP